MTPLLDWALANAVLVDAVGLAGRRRVIAPPAGVGPHPLAARAAAAICAAAVARAAAGLADASSGRTIRRGNDLR